MKCEAVRSSFDPRDKSGGLYRFLFLALLNQSMNPGVKTRRGYAEDALYPQGRLRSNVASLQGFGRNAKLFSYMKSATPFFFILHPSYQEILIINTISPTRDAPN